MTAGLHAVNGFGTGTDSVPTTTIRTGTGEQSDEVLLSVLDRYAKRIDRRPTRREVMDQTGTGNTRATRLLEVLDERHDWPKPGTKRGTRKTARGRSGTGTHMAPRPRRVPVPQAAPAGSSTGTHAGTQPGPDATAGTAEPTGTELAPAGSAGTGTQTAPATPAAAAGTGRRAGTEAGTETGTAESSGTGLRGGRFVSWAGFGFGSIVSIAGNVLHAWLPPVNAPAGWHPGIVPQLGAAVWPVMLLLAVEVLSRVRWRDEWQWRLARYGGTGTVAVGAAVISYGHVTAVLAAWGYGSLAAHVGPLVIDGLMVVSGFALLSHERENA